MCCSNWKFLCSLHTHTRTHIHPAASRQTHKVKLFLEKWVSLHIGSLKNKVLQSPREVPSFVEDIVRTQRI